jgi:capsular exopolysaccharide synthesis family protein
MPDKSPVSIVKTGAADEKALRQSVPAPRTKSIPVAEEVLRENRIVAATPGDERADLFRILRRQILQTLARNDQRTLAITSAKPGEGKSLVSVNLAVSLAMDVNQTILLVDLDLRRPKVHEYFSLPPGRGLPDYLAGKAELSDCLVRPAGFERLVVLPSHGHHPHSSEILSAPRMRNLAEELKSRYQDRIILYDLPPLLATDDALGFLPQVEAVLLVVAEGDTRQPELERAMELLKGTNVIGTVLNRAHETYYSY